MHSKQLRNSILQQAIQGKLVKQIAEEGTAKELLEEIRREREKLIKEGKIKRSKKNKELKPITDDEMPFEIPDSWEWVRFNDIFSTISAKQHEIKEKEILKSGKFPVVSQSKNQISGYSNEENKLLKIDKPVLIFGDHTRVLKYINFNFIIGADGVKILNPKIGNIKYLYYLLTYLIINMKNRGYQRHFNVLNTFLIPLPPLREQHRIVEKIETLEPFLKDFEENETKLNELEKNFPKQLKNSILQRAIQGKLVKQTAREGATKELLEEIKKERERLIKEGKIKQTKKDKELKPITEEEIPFEIPDSWEWVRLGKIANINGGYAFRGSNLTKNKNNDNVRVIRISDFDEKGIKNINEVYYKYNNIFEEFKLENNNIIIAMTGGTVGKNFLISNMRKNMYSNQRVATIKPINNNIIKYIGYIINSQYIQKIINENKNSTNDNISIPLINNFLVPLPPLQEQQRIVEKVDRILEELGLMKN